MVKKEGFSLLDFPIIQCWPQDAGRFITLPLVFSKNPETGKRNCGMYRMQVFDETTTAMHWQTHKHGAQHYREARRTEKGGKKMEVAATIGADPAVVFSAIAPLPDDLDEMIFAGFLRQKPVEMVPCKTVDLEVVANAEIVLEGYVDLDDLRPEGPFGDHTGYYSLAGPLSRLPRHLYYPSGRSYLSNHYRWKTSPGRLAIWATRWSVFFCL